MKVTRLIPKNPTHRQMRFGAFTIRPSAIRHIDALSDWGLRIVCRDGTQQRLMPDPQAIALITYISRSKQWTAREVDAEPPRRPLSPAPVAAYYRRKKDGTMEPIAFDPRRMDKRSAVTPTPTKSSP